MSSDEEQGLSFLRHRAQTEAPLFFHPAVSRTPQFLPSSIEDKLKVYHARREQYEQEQIERWSLVKQNQLEEKRKELVREKDIVKEATSRAEALKKVRGFAVLGEALVSWSSCVWINRVSVSVEDMIMIMQEEGDFIRHKVLWV